MLAQSLLESGLYDAGAFILIGPRLNNDIQRAAQAYRDHLTAPGHQTRFLNLPLEDAIATLGTAGAAAEAQRLYERYCDFAATSFGRRSSRPFRPNASEGREPSGADAVLRPGSGH